MKSAFSLIAIINVILATAATTFTLAFHPSSLPLVSRAVSSPWTSATTPTNTPCCFKPTSTAATAAVTTKRATARLYAGSSSSSTTTTVPETLATEGDWNAYLDEESTGLVYYFNSKTGESKWEPPTNTFPVVILPRSVRRKAEAKRMAYIKAVEEQQRANAATASSSSSSSTASSSSSSSSSSDSSGSIFSNLMDNLTGDSSSSSTTTPTTTSTTNKDDAMVSKKKQERWFDFLFDFDTKPAEQNEIEKQASLQQEREKSWLDSFLFPDGKQDVDDEAAAAAAAKKQKDKTKKKEEQQQGGGWFGSLFASKVYGDSSSAASSSKSKKRRETLQEEQEKQGNFFDNFLSPSGSGSDGSSATLEQPAAVSDSESSVVAEQQVEEKTTTTTPTTSTTTTTLPPPVVAEKEKKQVVEIIKETPPPEFQPIEIDMASYVMPHPQKIFWGGEDAVFIRGRTFGIFDGVSGAMKLDGVPLYSKTLASEMKKIVYQINPKSVNTDDDGGLNVRQLTDSLTTARTVADQTSTGASTAIVGSITADGYLRVLNLGDSSCLVIRNGKVVGKTREISHYFDCPYQLSTDSPDIPRDGTKMNMELVRGDIIVMGSDGIFDNLYPEDIVEIVANSPIYTSATGDSTNGYNVISKQNRKRWLPALAKQISDKSRKISLNKRVPTPYSVQSKKNGDPDYADGLGGKLDDISCIVVRYS